MLQRNRLWRRLGIGPLLVPLLVLLTGLAQGQGHGYRPRYQDQEDGTVLETRSGLVWLADANCWRPMPWEEAKAAVARLKEGSCGLTDGSQPGDWRLPTQKEWRAMVECSCGDIVLTDDQGTNCYTTGRSTFHSVQPMEYWSSTESANGGGRVIAMSLFDGFDRAAAPGAPLLVWPVRRASALDSQKDRGHKWQPSTSPRVRGARGSSRGQASSPDATGNEGEADRRMED